MGTGNPFESYADSIIRELPESSVPDDREEEGETPLWRQLEEMNGDAVRQENLDRLDDLAADQTSEDPFNQDEREAAREASREHGLEVFAFYKSRHFLLQAPFARKWGIFIFDYGIRSIASEIRSFYPGRFSASEASQLAFSFLHRHERFHFRFDAWVLSHEETLKRPLYADYLRSVYRKLHPMVHCVEESLANRHAIYSMKPDKIWDFLTAYIATLPPAYSNAFPADLQTMQATLAAQTFHTIVWPFKTGGSTLAHVPYLAHGQSPLVSDENCPVYIVYGVRPSRWVPPFKGIPDGREIRVFLENYLDAQAVKRTDHEYFKIDNGQRVKVPNLHGNDRLKAWEFKNIVYKAGMTIPDYRAERGRTNIWQSQVPREKPLFPIG